MFKKIEIPTSFAGDMFKKTSWVFNSMDIDVRPLGDIVVKEIVEQIIESKEPQLSAVKEKLLEESLETNDEDVLSCENCFTKIDIANRKFMPKSSFHSSVSDISKVKLFFLGPYPIDNDKDSKIILMEIAKCLELDNSEFVYVPLLRCLDGTELLGEHRDIIHANCFKHAAVEIERSSPRVVIAFGALVTNFLLGKREKITKIHGELLSKTVNTSRDSSLSFTWMPSFHPEMIMINKKVKESVWQDLDKIRSLLAT